MNKSELVDQIASQTGVTKSDTEAVLSAMFDTISDAVSKGEKVTIPGYLSVERTMRAARKGRNPRTGEPLDIPASHSVKVSAGSKLKAAAKG